MDRYTTVVPKDAIEASDTFNLARGLTGYVVAGICDRLGLDGPNPEDKIEAGYCTEDGTPVRGAGWGSHYGWTITKAAH